MKADVSHTVDSFVSLHRRLLEIERSAEISETVSALERYSLKELQSRGVCLVKLTISGQVTGLYGRTLVTFAPSRFCQPKGELPLLPSHSISSGDVVGVYLNAAEHKDPLASGVVWKVRDGEVVVALDERLDDGGSDLYRLMVLANDVTYRRLKQALDDLERVSSGDPCFPLVESLFNNADVGQTLALFNGRPLQFFNKNLDESQRQAVSYALQQSTIAVIHGPPGTGKSTTVTEIVQQCVKVLSMKVLLCAPSNIAVDNLLEKLAPAGMKIVRLGHPARAMPGVQKFSLDSILLHRDSSDIISSVRKDISEAQRNFKKCRGKGEVIALRQELKALRRELEERERGAIAQVLANADVILATTTSASRDGPLKHLPPGRVDLVIIDEAAQALEAACWIPMMHAKRCILAGDHNQLPPTILSTEAAKDGLAITLMERLMQMAIASDVARMLTMQYRMHEAIMKWPSAQLYMDRLQAAPSVARHLLKDLPGVEETADTSIPLLLVDTAGCGLLETDSEQDLSKGNEGEVNVVASHVKNLREAGVKMEDIGVITPYNLQVELLRQAMHPTFPAVEIRSVDGFQGREKEAIIISLVRSNQQGEIGFLSEDRRLNVAITRARRHLCVVCDSSTVSRHAFLKSFCDYATENGEVRSAREYLYCDESSSCAIAKSCPEGIASLVAPSKSKQGHSRALNMQDNVPRSNLAKPAKDLVKEPALAFPVPPPCQESLADIDGVIERFLSSSQERHVFPSSLSAQERRYVHEKAEKLGLVHKSFGQGAERSIAIEKMKTSVPTVQSGSEFHPVSDAVSKVGSSVCQQVDKNGSSVSVRDHRSRTKAVRPDKTDRNKDSHSLSQCSVSDKTDSNIDSHSLSQCSVSDRSVADRAGCVRAMDDTLAFLLCSFCGTSVPSSNFGLHEARCRRLAVEFSAENEKRASKKLDCDVSSDVSFDASSCRKKLSDGPSTKPKQGQTVPSSLGSKNEDFDTLVESFTKQNSSCGVSPCKANVKLFGQLCFFCSKLYCLKHHMAEVHGCGLQAKIKARQDISKPVAPGRPVSEVNRGHLNRKLNKKIDALEEMRKTKPKK